MPSKTTIPAGRLRGLIEEALWSIDSLDERDAWQFVDWFVDLVIGVLQQNPRIPHLSRDEWELLLADTTFKAADQLDELINNHIDASGLADVLADELLTAAASNKALRQATAGRAKGSAP
jgi:hypothetical protein